MRHVGNPIPGHEVLDLLVAGPQVEVDRDGCRHRLLQLPELQPLGQCQDVVSFLRVQQITIPYVTLNVLSHSSYVTASTTYLQLEVLIGRRTLGEAGLQAWRRANKHRNQSASWLLTTSAGSAQGQAQLSECRIGSPKLVIRWSTWMVFSAGVPLLMMMIMSSCFMPATDLKPLYNINTIDMARGYGHLASFSCWSLIFFCWFCNIAIEAVVLVMLGACPSHTILSSSLFYYSMRMFWPSPPKMSGRRQLKFYKFLLTSTLEPWEMVVEAAGVAVPCLMARQDLRCLLISEARNFCLQIVHCCSSYFFLGSEMIFYSRFLPLNRGLFSLNSLEYPVLGLKSSKMMVSTSSKSFQSILASFLSPFSSFLPLLCSCFTRWYSQTSLQRASIFSRSLTDSASLSSSSSPISMMCVQAATIFVKYSQFSEEERRNSN